MYIVHGTWIPEETDRFVQGGGLYVWVETDATLGPAGSGTKHNGTARTAATDHPRQLAGAALAEFLHGKLGIGKYGPEVLARTLSSKYVLLPSADGRPLPSVELAPYVEDELPLEHELVPWQIACYALPDVITTLNEIQFIALHAAEESSSATICCSGRSTPRRSRR